MKVKNGILVRIRNYLLQMYCGLTIHEVYPRMKKAGKTQLVFDICTRCNKIWLNNRFTKIQMFLLEAIK